MISSQDDLAAYFVAVHAMRSDDALIRRPAISTLFRLARQLPGSLQTRAARVLNEEFGPYAVSDGLSGCCAPFAIVESCDGECRACAWVWGPIPPTPSPQEERTKATVIQLESLN